MKTPFVFSFVIGLALAIAVFFMLSGQRDGRPHDRQSDADSVGFVAGVPVGGPFSLTDHTGQPVTEADFAGQHMLVFFGFTYCPDICPTELATIGQAMEMLGEAGTALQPVFITIDPERDTPEALAEYVALFHPRIVGLTGTPDAIAAVADAYRVYYAKVAADGGEAESGDAYLMDHSTFLYLMGPDGRLVEMYPHGITAADLADALRRRLTS